MISPPEHIYLSGDGTMATAAYTDIPGRYDLVAGTSMWRQVTKPELYIVQDDTDGHWYICDVPPSPPPPGGLSPSLSDPDPDPIANGQKILKSMITSLYPFSWDSLNKRAKFYWEYSEEEGVWKDDDRTTNIGEYR